MWCHPKTTASTKSPITRSPFLKAAWGRGDSRLPEGILTWDFPGEGGLQYSFYVCVGRRGNGQELRRVTDQYSFGNWISTGC